MQQDHIYCANTPCFTTFMGSVIQCKWQLAQSPLFITPCSYHPVGLLNPRILNYGALLHKLQMPKMGTQAKNYFKTLLKTCQYYME